MMDGINVYDDISHVDLGSEILKLEHQNRQLLEHIRKLEGDIKKLCTELTNMKESQQNLSKNISELFKTAKLEIQRKDRMILELRQEVEDLLSRQANNPRRFKRQLCERNLNEPPKRFKNNFNDDANPLQLEKGNTSPARSISDNAKINAPQTQSQDTRQTHMDYKNEEFDRDSRYSALNNRSKYRRNNRGYKEHRRYDSRYRRSRSSDRFGRRRSRSNDKYNRSKSQNRYRENRNDQYENDNNESSKSRNQRLSSSKSKERSPTRDIRESRDLRENRLKNRNLYSNRYIEKDEVLDLTCDLEEGELTAESDHLVIEDNVHDLKDISNKKISSHSNKADSKPITIEEYRSRKVKLEDESISTKDCIDTKETLRTELTLEEHEDKKRILEYALMKIEEDISKNLDNKSKDEYSNDLCSRKSSKVPETTSNITNTNLRANIVKAINDHIPAKPVDCKTDISSNECTNSILKLTMDNSDNSMSSNNCSFNNSENISNLSNDTANGNMKFRRRRCVVIGLKDKA